MPRSLRQFANQLAEAFLFLALAIVTLPSAVRAQSTTGVTALKGGGLETNLFGDWGGWRTRLHDQGIDIDLSYLGEAAWNAAGGKRRGIDYAGQEEAKIDLNWNKIAGLQGFSTHIDFINRNGRNASVDYVGDDLLQAQEIFGGGGDVLVHLAYLFLEQKLSGGMVDVKAGRLPVLLDFGYLPDSCDFMALGVCATWGLAKNPDWTPFPKATWGGNIHLKATQAISFRIGAYEVNPRQGEPTGFYWSLAGSTGAIVPFELDYETGVGQSGLPGIIKIGGYFDTSRYDDWYAAINGAPLPLTTLPPATSRRTGFYFLAQQMLWRTGPEPGEGLTGLAGYVHNTASVSIFQNFAFVGLLDEGLVPGRPHDRAGLSFVYAGVSHNLNAVQTLEAELGLPLTNNAPGVQANEMLIEANYAIAAYRGINVMPDLQFIIHPSAAHTYPDALVVGLQIRAHF